MRRRSPAKRTAALRTLLFLLLSSLAFPQRVITTIAGTDWIFRGDGQPALAAPLGGVLAMALAVDADGNYYLGDPDNANVMKVTPDGILHVIAGNGLCCYSGDGGPATAASLGTSSLAVAVDRAGTVYICDTGTGVIRKVTPDGIIQTVAGVAGALGFAGDGGPASAALFYFPYAIAVDGAGNLYIADQGNYRIRKISGKDGTITTVAGNGHAGTSGDGGQATAAAIDVVFGLALDSAGNLYLAVSGSQNVIRKVDTNGIITTVAGGGASNDVDIPAVEAAIIPNEVALDTAGTLYIADYHLSRVLKVDAQGILRLVAGGVGRGFSGDGGPATAAAVNIPIAVRIGPEGTIYIADRGNHRIRAVTTDGIINTVAGNGQFRLTGEGGAAMRATLFRPGGLATDARGNYYIAEPALNRVRRVAPDGTITVYAGTGTAGYSGDGGPATAAKLSTPIGLATDSAGNLYISDSLNSIVRRVTPDGTISTVAGTPGSLGFAGDRGLATRARLSFPAGIAVDRAGNLYIADAYNYRIRTVDTRGIISSLAGNGRLGDSGDGGNALLAELAQPTGIVVDSAGVVYFSEPQIIDLVGMPAAGLGNRVRRIGLDQTITTVVGNGNVSPPGDGGPARDATLFSPQGLALDTAGNLYIADSLNFRVRVVSPAGTITTIAGNGPFGILGDGGPATSAWLYAPGDVAVDAAGNLLIADTFNHRIRAVLAKPPTFQAGPISLSFAADAGSPPAGQQTVSLASATTGLLFATSVTTRDGGAWLQASPLAGGMPVSVGVTADASQLAPGTYQGSISIAAPSANPPAANVAVTFTVSPRAPGKLNVKADSLSFSFFQGAAAASQTLNLANDGGAGFDYAVALKGPGAQSVTATPGGGTLAAYAASSVTVTADPAGLAPGTYTVTLSVAASNGEQRDLPVTMTVSAIKQTINLLSRGLTFTAVAGGGVSPAQSIGVANVGQGVMSFAASGTTVSGGPAWLAVTPAAGSSDAVAGAAPVTVSVDPTGLDAGQYYGQVEIDAAQADNSPQFAMVVLSVLPAGSNPGPIVQPAGMTFTAVAGGESPGSQSIVVSNLTGAPISYTAGILTVDGAQWLVAAPGQATVAPGDSSQIVVQPSTVPVGRSALATGVYQATITLLFDGGASRTVSVAFVLRSTAALSAGQRAGRRDNPGDCPNKLLPLFTSFSAGVTVAAGWPTGIGVNVVDDCGTPLTSGSVVAQFSNGDPPLALSSLRNGGWNGTWQAGNVASAVTIKVTAQDPDRGLKGTAEMSGGVTANPGIPVVSQGGVVNSASLVQQAPLAPGSLITVFGSELAGGQNAALGLPWPAALAGSAVAIQGRFIPLQNASGGRVDAVLPFDLPMNTRLPLVVQRGSSLTLPVLVTIAASAPAIFAKDSSGSGQGMIFAAAADGSAVLAAPGSPARAGDQVVMQCTGLGAVNAIVNAGSAAPDSPPASALAAVAVNIGGTDAPVVSATLEPGMTGVYLVTASVPAGVTGDAVPVTLSVAGQSSPAVTMAVQ